MSDLLPTADVVGSAGLALAALTVLYGQWMPVITGAKSTRKEKHLADRGPALQAMRAALWRMALPLALAATLLAAALTPSAVSVLRSTWNAVTTDHLMAFEHYQPALAVFQIVWLFLAMLVILTWVQVIRLGRRIQEFKGS